MQMQMQMQCLPGEPDEFDYLLRWQDTAEDDDEIIDFAADADLEDDEHADWAEDDMDVLNSDENEELPTRCRLSDKEIYDIIDERINFYMDSWKPNAGAIPGEEVEYDVNALWDKAEASGERQILVQKYEADYAYFKNRLDKMREEIKSFPGSNATQIRQQCRNLEGTIESVELAGWLRDIYKLEPVADGDEELVNGEDELANYSNERANSCESALDYSDDLANHSDGLVDYSDDAVHDATPPRSHVVSDTEIIDLDLLRDPVRKSTLNANKPTQDAAYLFGIPRKHQTQIPPPKSRIAHSIEPMVDRHHESRNLTRSLNHGDEPEKASYRSVRRWKWHELIEHLDRKRIVSKAIFEMNVSDREAVRTRVRLIKKTNLLREIAAYINMLKRGKSELPCILPQDMRKITNFTNLFLSWWFCKNYFKEPNASIGDLDELQSCIEDGSAGTTTFYDYVRTIMNTTFSEEALQHPEQPSQAEIIEISDDD